MDDNCCPILEVYYQLIFIKTKHIVHSKVYIIIVNTFSLMRSFLASALQVIVNFLKNIVDQYNDIIIISFMRIR